MKSYEMPKGFMLYGMAFLLWTLLMGVIEDINILAVAGLTGITLMLVAKLLSSKGRAEKLVMTAFIFSGISYLIVGKVPYVALSFIGIGLYYISSKAVEAELMPFKILRSLRSQGITGKE
jgi:hypothetical protein